MIVTKEEDPVAGPMVQITLAPGEAFQCLEELTALTSKTFCSKNGESLEAEPKMSPVAYLGVRLRSIVYGDFMGHDDES